MTETFAAIGSLLLGFFAGLYAAFLIACWFRGHVFHCRCNDFMKEKLFAKCPNCFDTATPCKFGWDRK